MFYNIYYVLFNDNSYKPIVIIAVYDTIVLVVWGTGCVIPVL